MARIIEKRPLLGRAEKEMLRRLMRKYADFCGLRIFTYSFLNTHTHLLVGVPERVDIDDAELERRLKLIYKPLEVKQITEQIQELRSQGLEHAAEAFKRRYTYRMYDLSEFFKTLQWTFSTWYNRRHGRCGTFWNERFKSVLVEGSEQALMATAAYIDLNAVRAGLVTDPKNYRFSGYGEAMGGGKAAREGLKALTEVYGIYAPWGKVRGMYRRWLYACGRRRLGDEVQGEASRPGFSLEQVQMVLNANGELPLPELLRCRVRYFTEGMAIGSREFVEQVFRQHRDRFSSKRIQAAHPMRHGHWQGLCTLRALLTNPVSVP
jgi:REP element-mobilizing transposase RayT